MGQATSQLNLVVPIRFLRFCLVFLLSFVGDFHSPQELSTFSRVGLMTKQKKGGRPVPVAFSRLRRALEADRRLLLQEAAEAQEELKEPLGFPEGTGRIFRWLWQPKLKDRRGKPQGFWSIPLTRASRFGIPVFGATAR